MSRRFNCNLYVDDKRQKQHDFVAELQDFSIKLYCSKSDLSVCKPAKSINDAVGGFNEQLGLLLTLALQKTNYGLGESVNITFTITNISGRTISLFHYFVGAFNMFEFRVYNDTDNSIWSEIYPVYPGGNPGGPVVTVTFLDSGDSLTGGLVWEQTYNSTAFSQGVPVSLGTYYIVGQIGPIFMNGLTVETTPIQIVIA